MHHIGGPNALFFSDWLHSLPIRGRVNYETVWIGSLYCVHSGQYGFFCDCDEHLSSTSGINFPNDHLIRLQASYL
jgi:hypothetical protein